MVLKRPRQGQSLAAFKTKEMLLLSALSPEAAAKFIAAMRLAAVHARYTGSPYHRAPGSKEGPIARRVGLTSRCPPSWTNIEATRVLRIAITEGQVSIIWEQGYAHSDEVGRRFRAKPAACTD
jgi:hypothetical protein